MIANIYVNVLKYGERSRKSTNIAETVPLKDYVIGVAYRALGASVSDNEEYLKANIIAIKSYTLGRPITMGDGIKQVGDKYYINMRNSTNDQVYCSLTKGCMDAIDGNRKPAPSQALIDYLGRLYDEVADKFLYDSQAENFVGSFRNKASMQIKKEELNKLLKAYYNGSFAQLACDYIRHMGVTMQEVELILEEIRKAKGASRPFCHISIHHSFFYHTDTVSGQEFLQILDLADKFASLVSVFHHDSL
jgi:hypothetical protein